MQANAENNQHSIIYVIFFALCMSIVVYTTLAVTEMFGKGADPSISWPSENLMALQNVPLYMAILIGSISFFFRKWVINEQRLKDMFSNFEGSQEDKKKMVFAHLFTLHILIFDSIEYTTKPSLR